MNREFWKDFHAWLDRATIDEIFAARNKAREDITCFLDNKELQSDLKRMMHFMDEEIVTRGDFVSLVRK